MLSRNCLVLMWREGRRGGIGIEVEPLSHKVVYANCTLSRCTENVESPLRRRSLSMQYIMQGGRRARASDFRPKCYALLCYSVEIRLLCRNITIQYTVEGMTTYSKVKTGFVWCTEVQTLALQFVFSVIRVLRDTNLHSIIVNRRDGGKTTLLFLTLGSTFEKMRENATICVPSTCPRLQA